MIEFNVDWQGAAIAVAAGTTYHRGDDQVIAYTSDDRLMGGVIFKDYTRASIAMHVASFLPGWVTRDMLWVCFNYPFEQLGVGLVTGVVPSSNSKALAFNRHLGFKEVAVISDVFPGADAVVMAMRRDECRWLAIKPTTIVKGEHSDGWQDRSPAGT